MKFYCDVCNTKYSIADEKIRGKVLKVRCKKCSNIITVREAQTPVDSPRSADSSVRDTPKSSHKGPSLTRLPESNWYYSINGQSSGPFELERLQKRFRSGELGDECYVWHESLVEWKPVASSPGFAEALKEGQQRKPRPKTLGYTGKVQAIDAPTGPNQQREGAVPDTQEKGRSVPTPENSRSPSRNERIERLRKKLRVEKSEPQTQKAPSLPVSGPASSNAAPEPQSTAELTFDSDVEHAADVETADTKTVSELPDFGLSPAPKVAEPTSSTSDILDASEEQAPLPAGLGQEEPELDPEAVEDSGVIPFFPDAPKLKSAGAPPTGNQTTTGSLLIQLKDIQREGRGKAVALVTVAALVIGGLVATAITVSILNHGEEAEEVASATPTKSAPKELKERRYSQSELDRFGALVLEEEVISREDSQELEDDPDESPQAAQAPAEKRSQKAPKTVIKQPDGAAEAVGMASPSVGKDKAPGSAKPKTNQEDSTTKEAPDKVVEEEPKTARERLLGYSGRATTNTINRPEDKLTSKAELPNTLQKEDARKGFREIRKSVMTCRERFLRRGGRFDQPKIMVTVVVQPTGKVTKISTNPSTLSGTEFDRCMQSHRNRWRFARWTGDPQEVSSSYVLQ